MDLLDKYACFCPDGYRGRRCEDDVDVCLEAPGDASPCFNGATCVDGDGANFTCRSVSPHFLRSINTHTHAR